MLREPYVRVIDIFLLNKVFFNEVGLFKNKKGGACGAYGGGEKCAQICGGETWGKETTGETQT